MNDWAEFDETISKGNGPWRSVFESVLRRGEPMPTGIPFLDHYLEGGLRPGVLNVIAGRTTEGKTLLTRTVIKENHDKRILYLVADEEREQIGFDLAGTILNQRGFEVEAELRDPASGLDPSILEAKLMAAYPNLHVPDESLLGATVEDVASMVDQAERMWGAPAELIVFDFMGCLDIEGGDVSTVGMVHARMHKVLCRMFPESVWLLISQMRRNNTGKTEVPSLERMFGGGEAAIDGCAIGVWRWAASERKVDDTQVMINIMKAKQGRAYPGGPAKIKDAGENPRKNAHVHEITRGSTIHPKQWPMSDEVFHPSMAGVALLEGEMNE